MNNPKTKDLFVLFFKIGNFNVFSMLFRRLLDIVTMCPLANLHYLIFLTSS